MKKNRKKRILLFLLILSCLLITFGVSVYAGELIVENPDLGEYLFNKFPISRYVIDNYIPTENSWLPWKWGKIANDARYAMLALRQEGTFYSAFSNFNLIGFLIQKMYQFDLVELLGVIVTTFVQGVAGVDSKGRFASNGLFAQFFVIAIVITGVTTTYKITRGQTGEAINKILLFVLLGVTSLLMVMKAGVIYKEVNELTNHVESVILRSGTNALGIDGDPAIALREAFFDITIYQPYLLLQYGTTDVEQERVDELLEHAINSQEREEIVKREVEENGNSNMNVMENYYERNFMTIPLIVSGAVLSVEVVGLVAIRLVHQLIFILCVCMIPYVLIIALCFGRFEIAIRLFSKIFYELCMRIAITMLICIMMGISTALFTVTGSGGYLLGAVLQIVLFVGIFLCRKKILRIFTEKQQGQQRIKGKSIKGMLVDFYAFNRGIKALKGAIGVASGGTAQVADQAVSQTIKRAQARKDSVDKMRKGRNSSNSNHNSNEGGGKYEQNENREYFSQKNEQRQGVSGKNGKDIKRRKRSREQAQTAQTADSGGTLKRGTVERKHARGDLVKEDYRNKSLHLAKAKKYRTSEKKNVPSIKSAKMKELRKYENMKRRKPSIGRHVAMSNVSKEDNKEYFKGKLTGRQTENQSGKMKRRRGESENPSRKSEKGVDEKFDTGKDYTKVQKINGVERPDNKHQESIQQRRNDIKNTNTEKGKKELNSSIRNESVNSVNAYRTLSNNTKKQDNIDKKQQKNNAFNTTTQRNMNIGKEVNQDRQNRISYFRYQHNERPMSKAEDKLFDVDSKNMEKDKKD